MLDRVKKEYNQAIFDTDKITALKVIHEAFSAGLSPEDIVFNVVVPSIEYMSTSISQDFGTNLAQHFMTAQIAAQVTDEMLSKFKTPPEIIGKIVIGTSNGDFHGLGKKIVIGCLKAQMIDAIDLGLNVAPEKFVDEAIANNAQIIGISSMMLHTACGENGCIKVRQILNERNLEGKIKIIVGGAPYRYNRELFKTVQADAWAENGIDAGTIVAGLIKDIIL
jgi:methanogenic corrinoid protein MtbC1